jgi:hypothetical protein
MPETEIIRQFVVKYDGLDAARGLLDGEALGESIRGAARLYTAVAHYVSFGEVPPTGRRYRKRFRSFARPATPGSWDQIWFIGPAVYGEYSIHADVYNKAASWIFGRVLGSIKAIWTRPTETQKVVEHLTNAMVEQARANAEVHQTLASGLVHQNDNMTTLMGQLIDTVPRLAETTRPHARKFVTPIGSTCTDIIQAPGHDDEIHIGESDAEVIRGDVAFEVDDMAQFRVNQISEIDLRTGHCFLNVEGIGDVPGKITDPSLGVPDNAYTRALNAHKPVIVQAKAVRRGATIQRLFISNSIGEA